MAIDIPTLDTSPKVLFFEPRSDGYFPIIPGPGPIRYVMATNDSVEIVESDSWLEVDLKRATDFCRKGGGLFGVHSKRTWGLLAHWHWLKTGDPSSYAFRDLYDICDMFYGPDMIMTFDERRNFGVPLINKIMDAGWEYDPKDPDSLNKVARMLLFICQRISGH